MIDRAALLLPRLPRSQQSAGQVLNHLLHSLRIGLSVMHLRRCYPLAERAMARDINEVLSLLTRTTDPRALRQRIVAMIDVSLSATHEPSRQMVDRLVDLYCALREQDREQLHD